MVSIRGFSSWGVFGVIRVVGRGGSDAFYASSRGVRWVSSVSIYTDVRLSGTISDHRSRLGEDILEALECDGVWLRAGL